MVPLPPGDLEFYQQIRETDVLHRIKPPCGSHAQSAGEIGFAAAGGTQQDDVVVLLDVVAGAEPQQFLLLQTSVGQILHILQPFRGVLVCQLQQTHTGLVALLLYLVAAENGLDSDLRVAADFTGPPLPPSKLPTQKVWAAEGAGRAFLPQSCWPGCPPFSGKVCG